MRILTCLVEDHHLGLTLLAAVICILGSLVTARFYRRVRDSHPGARLAWSFMGAVAGGATIWCTHFVAMMAYNPGVDVAYEPVLTAISLAVAILGAIAALLVGSLKMRRAPELGGALFGLTIATMHYVGMAAFMTEALIIWHVVYVVASVISAVVFGALAFRIVATAKSRHWLILSSLVMVLAIVALHFTGMGALEIIPLAPADGMMNGESASGLLALAVAGVGFLILATATASNALENQSRRSAGARMKQLIEGSVDGMLIERQGRIVIANGAFLALCGADAEGLTDAPLSDWLDGADTLPNDRLMQTELKTRDGEVIPVEVAVRKEHDAETRSSVRIFAVRDLRNRIAQERRIAHLARNDGLTGLPNRSSFLEKLQRHTAATGEDERFALLAIDLDRFKEVNDLYGHAVGDQLLVHVAQQLTGALHKGEFVARLGGDEFVAIVPVVDRDMALARAEQIREAIIVPTEIEQLEVLCGASVGIALWPDDTTEPSVLINNADLAMYRAKAALGVDVCFYEEAMDVAVRQRRRLTQDLREALDQERFELHYQVQTSVETNAITGYEVLLRWPQADGSFISPVDFIPLAEETGLILPLGEWVLRQACTEAARWTEPHKIAVNLSPVQLSHVDLPRLVHQILVETGLSPRRLELEITETAMITDMDRSTHILRQLKLLGVSIAMDDFGTGYSSLSTLRAFPFDKIKLDRSFMSELDDSAQSRAIIRAVLALGESLNVPVLAEGVETELQLAFLRDQGCNEVQGYLLGRPGRVSDSAPPQLMPRPVNLDDVADDRLTA